MAGRPEFLSVLRQVGFSLSNGNFPLLNFKPPQVKSFESILKGQDAVGVLPTGSGKSMLWMLWLSLASLVMVKYGYVMVKSGKSMFPNTPEVSQIIVAFSMLS